MSIARASLEADLIKTFPVDVISKLIDEYLGIKHSFFLRQFKPAELDAARFCECVLRLIEYLDSGTFTPLGQQLGTENIIRRAENNVGLTDGIRFLIPRLTRVLLDVRNKRNVAHVGMEVDPNYSDSLLVTHAADWILIELIRNYHTINIDEARKIVESINQVKVPIIAEVDGFVRVQNTSLKNDEKALIILYYKQPSKVTDKDLCTWVRYSNFSVFKTKILKKLDDDALIHYENGTCTLLPKGILYIEKNIDPSLIV